jgi:alpha-L-fucosidase
MPNGKIQPEFVSRLHEVGEWLRAHAASIYGTRGGPVPPRPWGVTTRKGDTVYVHVLDWPDTALVLAALRPPVKSARLLKTGAPVPVRAITEGVPLTLPASPPDPFDTVVAVELHASGSTSQERHP